MLLSLLLGVVAAVIAFRSLNSGSSDLTDSIKTRADRYWELLLFVGSVAATVGVLWIDSMLWTGLIIIEIGIIGRYRRNWRRQQRLSIK